ncbi:unnamed protein product [Diamesa tonsa]
MWSRLLLINCLESVQKLKFQLNNQNVNILTYLVIFIFVVYFFLNLLLKKILKKSKIPRIKHTQTINLTFNFIFSFTSAVFLILYHGYFIQEKLESELGKWYPQQKNLLFFKPCDLVKFKIITLILVSFNIVSGTIDLKCREYLEAFCKGSFSALIISCYYYELENYSIVLNINMALFHVFNDLLSLLALYTGKNKIMMFRIFLCFKLLAWIYIFSKFLPFQYMLPTLYAKDFKLVMNICFIIWYISENLNSPVLSVFHHQLYHKYDITDCHEENSLARCVMLKDSQEHRHLKILKKSYYEVKLYNEKYNLSKVNLGDSAASATAYQTIKCMMTLKRKLKKIRSTKEHQHKD